MRIHTWQCSTPFVTPKRFHEFSKSVQRSRRHRSRFKDRPPTTTFWPMSGLLPRRSPRRGVAPERCSAYLELGSPQPRSLFLWASAHLHDLAAVWFLDLAPRGRGGGSYICASRTLWGQLRGGNGAARLSARSRPMCTFRMLERRVYKCAFWLTGGPCSAPAQMTPSLREPEADPGAPLSEHFALLAF